MLNSSPCDRGFGWRKAGLLGALMAAASCGTSGLEPSFDQDLATSLARSEMRRIETPDILLHFPANRHDEALRFLARAEGCVRFLRARTKIDNGVVNRKLVLIMPDFAMNNAFVSPGMGGEPRYGVVPTYNTTELFGLESGLPPDPAAIGCHELTHYVQDQQIGGFGWFINSIFGEASYSPQAGLDSWFSEGLAVHYETAMQPGLGRLTWPYFRGTFAAGVAGRRLHGGDLSTFNRDAVQGNNYLVGSHFIRFLVDRYGEEKLWRLIAVQGRSILFPFGVNLRFWQVYDKSLSTLIDEFADDVAARYPVRTRPPEQRTLLASGYGARYARAADGTQALIDECHDRPMRLSILDASGRVRAERTLVDVVPPRKLTIASASDISGLSFTADARSLYFVSVDRGAIYLRATLLRYDVASDDLQVVRSDLGGLGGAISGDGRRYVFARPDGDRHDLAELELSSGEVRVLWQAPPHTFVAHPRYAPDGSRIVATVFEPGGASGGADQRFVLALFDGASGRRLETLPTGDGPATDASFVDGQRLVYLGVASARRAGPNAKGEDAAASGAAREVTEGFQVYSYDLRAHRAVPVTRAPYLAFQPQAAGGDTVRFLNREGWAWTLDEVPLPRTPASASLPAPPPEPRLVAAPLDPTVLSEKPYSALDSVFVPRLLSLFYMPPIFGQTQHLAASVSGKDRLQFHSWAANVIYQPKDNLWSYVLGYANRQLAPFTVALVGAQLRSMETPDVPAGTPAGAPPPPALLQRSSLLVGSVSREVFGNPVGAGAEYNETYQPDAADPLLVRRRLGGPFIEAAFIGVEGTPYSGLRRGFVVAARATAYPGAWSTNNLAFTDVRGLVVLATPLPLSRRHTFVLRMTGRTLAGAPEDRPLLQVGGLLGGVLWRYPRPPVPTLDMPLLPEGAFFYEDLRGFEDLPLQTNTFLSANGTYTLPLIVDKGTASSLGVLPAAFFRQVDLVAFGDVALTKAAGAFERHAAVGAALTVGLGFWRLPFDVVYQAGRRLTDDQAFTQLVLVGI